MIERAASKRLFIDAPQYQIIGVEGETLRMLSLRSRLLMDPQAPTWWRWLTPVIHRHEDFPQMCDLLSCPVWVVDDKKRETMDWIMATTRGIMARLEPPLAVPGLAPLLLSDDGAAWLGRLRSTLERDGFYQNPHAETISRP